VVLMAYVVRRNERIEPAGAGAARQHAGPAKVERTLPRHRGIGMPSAAQFYGVSFFDKNTDGGGPER
jgi:hypothetical protein